MNSKLVSGNYDNFNYQTNIKNYQINFGENFQQQEDFQQSARNFTPYDFPRNIRSSQSAYRKKRFINNSNIDKNNNKVANQNSTKNLYLQENQDPLNFDNNNNNIAKSSQNFYQKQNFIDKIKIPQSVNHQQNFSQQILRQRFSAHPIRPTREFEKQHQQSQNQISYGNYVSHAPLIKQNLLTPQLQSNESQKSRQIQSSKLEKQQNMKIYSEINTEKLFFKDVINQKQQIEKPKSMLQIDKQANKKINQIIDNCVKDVNQIDKINLYQNKFKKFKKNEQQQLMEIKKNKELNFDEDKYQLQKDYQTQFITKTLNNNYFWKSSSKQMEKDEMYYDQLFSQTTSKKVQNQLEQQKDFQKHVQFKNEDGTKKVLIIHIFNLENAKRTGNIQHIYLDLPKVDEELLEQEEKRIKNKTHKGPKLNDLEFEKFKIQIIKQLKLNQNKQLYVYLGDGTMIQNHTQVPLLENVLYVGHQVVFKGLQNIFCSQQQKNVLYELIQNLQDKIQVIFNKEMRQKELQKYKKDKNYSSQYFKNGKFLTVEEYMENQINNQKKEKKLHLFDQFAYVNQRVQKQNEIENNYDPYLGIHTINNNKQLQAQVQNMERLLFLDISERFCKETKTAFNKQQLLEKFKKREQQIEVIKNLLLQDFFNNCNGIALSQFNSELLQNPQSDIEISDYIILEQKEINILYLLFKCLLEVCTHIHSQADIIKKGMNCSSFQFDMNSLAAKRQVDKSNLSEFLQNEQQNIMDYLCDYRKIINWKSTLDIINLIAFKSASQRTQILMTVADEDRSGTLDKEEVMDLCQLVMDKMINDEYQDIKKQLGKFYTEIFFSSMQDYAQALKNESSKEEKEPKLQQFEEISLNTVKKAALKGREESDLLCFFCGAAKIEDEEGNQVSVNKQNLINKQFQTSIQSQNAQLSSSNY
ncbi:hypothetical protein PPERSA_00885 [Pseudocohnilembus persalinus]|uniref:EF-hand domain-containing protein n=1 Tax=Pseudocohnilembus persalinus TaxID=266149 RepID=A0A0V0QEL9_PSEPJ|nr:hypothetical protein PPERSA_00885 [Pseudocohnilembus persalinus]|eukprot:KRX00658.1 hypothetical protein PPERSA_00885 [Pseudocohnilembus persalinus]